MPAEAKPKFWIKRLRKKKSKEGKADEGGRRKSKEGKEEKEESAAYLPTEGTELVQELKRAIENANLEREVPLLVFKSFAVHAARCARALALGDSMMVFGERGSGRSEILRSGAYLASVGIRAADASVSRQEWTEKLRSIVIEAVAGVRSAVLLRVGVSPEFILDDAVHLMADGLVPGLLDHDDALRELRATLRDFRVLQLLGMGLF